MSTALVIGLGDMGERIAAGLAASRLVRRLVVASRSESTVAAAAAAIASSADCVVDGRRVDASRFEDVADLIARTRPNLVVQCASLRNPWELGHRDDPVATGVEAAGLALRLPYQLTVPLAVMRAVKACGFNGPVANLSYPDGVGPVLREAGLAPAIGLGNAGMMLRRVRAALRAADPATEPPLVRIVAHHSQLDGVMHGKAPDDDADRCRVYLGEDGRRDDGAAYRFAPVAEERRSNLVTAAAALPVLEALLPGGTVLRWSVPAPAGLPGGFPVRIEHGRIALDLPGGESLEDAVAFNRRMARRDGIDRIDDEGTVHFTDAAREAVAAFAPDLADPLPLADLEARTARLDEVVYNPG